eukprot:jgi/Orpsp1_1/1186570/evm.model.d7180000051601.1
MKLFYNISILLLLILNSVIYAKNNSTEILSDADKEQYINEIISDCERIGGDEIHYSYPDYPSIYCYYVCTKNNKIIDTRGDLKPFGCDIGNEYLATGCFAHPRNYNHVVIKTPDEKVYGSTTKALPISSTIKSDPSSETLPPKYINKEQYINKIISDCERIGGDEIHYSYPNDSSIYCYYVCTKNNKIIDKKGELKLSGCDIGDEYYAPGCFAHPHNYNDVVIKTPDEKVSGSTTKPLSII